MIWFNRPVLLSLCTFVVLMGASYAGVLLRRWKPPMDSEEREDYALVLGATLTLLGLIIGFSFSMATSRYDMRKNYEEAEANAIGTEYVRTDFMPGASGEKTRALLKEYLQERIDFYDARKREQLGEINARTGKTQGELWAAVREVGAADRSAVSALVVNGMNDVLNSQGYTQAAWWNRIPTAAWFLMIAIAVCGNGLVGFYSGTKEARKAGMIILPLVLSISFMLIADIDSPRGGIIQGASAESAEPAEVAAVESRGSARGIRSGRGKVIARANCREFGIIGL